MQPSLRSTSQMLNRIKRRVAYLAETMTDITDSLHLRLDPSNALPHLFPSRVVGCVDSFPIFIRRPKDATLRRLTYCGKFKRHCLKVCFDVALLPQAVLQVQLVCSHSGVPLYFSGPCLPRHDSYIFQSTCSTMPFGPEELLLGDLAYIKFDGVRVVTGFKRLPGKNLSALQADFNSVQSW